MAQKENTPRLLSNVAVHNFYSRQQSQPQAVIPVSNHQAPREATTVTHQDTPTNSNIHKKPPRPAHCTKTKNKAQTKAIPRKEFKAIKKKLRKRELRRQNAVEICRIRAIEAAQKPT
ncbi:hypothetical protein BGZ89_002342 [Linnemannia elongata]|nr:hypothetical protein BGZ89_002342 [Linnemannia elongata]